MSTRARFHAFALSAALSAALAALAGAPVLAQVEVQPPPPPQEGPPPPGGPPSVEPLKPVEPPAELPKPQAGDPKQNLDRLFRALKIAPSDESAKFFENRIWALWLASGGDTGNLLMGRVKTAMDEKDFDSAIADIGEVLKREPRHFGALSGLGMIMQELGDEKAALTAFRRALEVHPKLEKIPDIVKKLTETVEGRPI